MGTVEPIYGIDDSPTEFMWDGRMLHNWWAAGFDDNGSVNVFDSLAFQNTFDGGC
ncbi:MAG: hypothetical protein AAFV77_12280 [Planctomycetota bacterium]